MYALWDNRPHQKHQNNHAPHKSFPVRKKFRIGSQCCGCMSRHFNFGNDRNETVGCVLHNFLYFFLRIIASLFFSIVTPWKIIIRVSYLSLFTIRTYFSQFRVFLYFYSPSLVICQMKMEFIQFIECHQIKKTSALPLWAEITSYIHHSPTMRETGSIRNADSRNPNLSFVFPVTIINGCRHELQQRLDTIKKSGGSFIGRYIYPIGRNLQCIASLGKELSIDKQISAFPVSEIPFSVTEVFFNASSK